MRKALTQPLLCPHSSSRPRAVRIRYTILLNLHKWRLFRATGFPNVVKVQHLMFEGSRFVSSTSYTMATPYKAQQLMFEGSHVVKQLIWDGSCLRHTVTLIHSPGMRCCRMYSSGKALLFGDDFASDPVTRTLGICLRIFSGGQLDLDLQAFSQVNIWSPVF